MSDKKIIVGIELTKVSAENAIKPLQDFHNKHHSMKSITEEMHKHHTMFQGAGNYIPRVGAKTVQVQQDLEEYQALKGKNAAYKEWLHKLNRNDKLPRGKFFKGKKAGKPIILMDEFWQFCSKSES